MTRPREQDTVRAILLFLHLHRILAWRVNSGGFRAEYKGKTRFHRFGAVGMSDIIGAVPPTGRVLAIEVKSATGKVTTAQEAFLAQLRGAGGLAFVARSVADVQRVLGL
jgi:hypothetical protein